MVLIAVLHVLAAITDPRVIAAILEHIDTWAAREPPIASSRARHQYRTAVHGAAAADTARAAGHHPCLAT